MNVRFSFAFVFVNGPTSATHVDRFLKEKSVNRLLKGSENFALVLSWRLLSGGPVSGAPLVSL